MLIDYKQNNFYLFSLFKIYFIVITLCINGNLSYIRFVTYLITLALKNKS